MLTPEERVSNLLRFGEGLFGKRALGALPHGYTAYMVMAGVNKHTGVPLSRPRPLSALSQLPGQLAAATAQRPGQRGYRRHALAWERSRGAPAVHIQKKSTAARTFCRRLAFVPAVFIFKARGWLPDDTSILGFEMPS
jgi:hypothetical protein